MRNFTLASPPAFGNSCRGLLVMGDAFGHIFLCNPTTKQFQFIPPTEDITYFSIQQLSLGYDSKSGDYKLLRVTIRMREPDRTNRTKTELYSVKNDSWKTIPNCDCFLYGRGEYVDDRCYWLDLYGSKVISFDFSEESFSYLPVPREPPEPEDRLDKFLLFKLDNEDSVGLILVWPRSGGIYSCGKRIGGDYYQFWVWRDGSWCLHKNVVLSGCYDLSDMIDGRFMFLEGPSSQSLIPYECHQVVYDWNGKECMYLGLIERRNNIIFFSYVQSTFALPHGKPINGSRYLNHIQTDSEPILKWANDGYDSDLDLGLDDDNLNLIDSFANGFRVFDDTEEAVEVLEEDEDEEMDPNTEELVANWQKNHSRYVVGISHGTKAPGAPFAECGSLPLRGMCCSVSTENNLKFLTGYGLQLPGIDCSFAKNNRHIEGSKLSQPWLAHTLLSLGCCVRGRGPLGWIGQIGGSNLSPPLLGCRKNNMPLEGSKLSQPWLCHSLLSLGCSVRGRGPVGWIGRIGIGGSNLSQLWLAPSLPLLGCRMKGSLRIFY
ncbi:uncharacterized protein LOC131004529 isoform X2 [Salvia miltiorrhiza]|uniref:uncharacterized protein LOC131004529 isoform X2 n=1 Tax=Salvia miltiorrhiza TaxID=226208 RepID=UPI0025AD06CB|nr:uncharacterized protein LOC131004529 isoform X2 [Salvia miltiorrhiza]